MNPDDDPWADDAGWLGPPVPEGDRTAARAMLAAVAAGEFGTDERVWLRDVATAILAADDAPGDARRRAERIAEAIGLVGRIDQHRELRTLVQTVEAFDILDGEPRRGERMRNLIEHGRSRGLIPDLMDDTEARKLIDRLLREDPDVTR